MGDELIQLEYYHRKLCDIAKDRSKFSKITRTVIGKEFMEGLSYDFLIRNEVDQFLLPSQL